ncbi:hypothetical protein [Nostoc sp. 'Lobaria pulmonaria (5183) cyanobiont']|uniref:hypothetical protein n=1 Tax=Nostoc sp. 'Lobaria pulmonaria (5183) cyanobiont' TaxID=1618022 RepID=UPI000CF339E8|nr:hypothetical protein [Nostoc sp. 'Lobaria pulmonaria (5183) cyanobiont']AVH71034.1 hypothetical protein NLP_2328 [Nostoc sp. 'Lobaria pulmonaria (5183) cyanobiont']
MIISDLNYLENTSEEVIGGFNRSSSSNFNETLTVKKTVESNLTVKGNLATSEGDAQAIGSNTVTQSILGASTTPRSSNSGGFVLAGTN